MKDIEQERTGGYSWSYRLTEDGGAEVLGLSSSVPAGRLVIPAQLGGHPVTSIDSEAFFGCVGMTEIGLPASVARIGRHAFGECPNLKTFTVAAESPFFVFEDGYLLSRDRRLLVRALHPKGEVTIPAGVKVIDVGAFSRCTEMTSVILPEGVEVICEDAFEFCGELTTMTLPRSLVAISWDVTYGCPKLKTMRVATGDAERIQELFLEWTSADVNCDFVYEGTHEG